MIKENIRAEMRAKRRALTNDKARELSGRIHENIFSLSCVNGAKTVCTFLSAFKEPDTVTVVKRLLEKGCKVAVPISDTDTCTVSLSYIDSAEDMGRGAYGIPEPAVIKPACAEDIDVILVPGLAFDRNGGRLGFGKGYYDKLLFGTDAVKIGICYSFQLLNGIPTEKHDIPMDYVITENEIIKVR